MHRFRTTHTPVKGLTSDILIFAANLCFGRSTNFERYAPTQLEFQKAISIALADLNPDSYSTAHVLSQETREQLANA